MKIFSPRKAEIFLAQETSEEKETSGENTSTHKLNNGDVFLNGFHYMRII